MLQTYTTAVSIAWRRVAAWRQPYAGSTRFAECTEVGRKHGGRPNAVAGTSVPRFVALRRDHMGMQFHNVRFVVMSLAHQLRCCGQRRTMDQKNGSSLPPEILQSPHASDRGKVTPTAASVKQWLAIDQAMCRYVGGDNRAFAEVYDYLAPKLLSFLRHLSGSSDAAQDLRQETFLCMHRARDSFMLDRHVAPWAYAIATHCYIDRGRALQAKFARMTDDATDVEVCVGPGATGEDFAIARQCAEVIHRTLSSMTGLRRDAFNMLRCEEMSVADAAQRVGVTEGALKLRAFHAYELVRAAIGTSREPGRSSPAEGIADA